MEMLGSIAQSLGFNSTLWIHLACFAISYISLYLLVFKPYAAALEERKSRTVGQEAAAGSVLSQVNEIQSKYEERAKALNAEISSLFEASRKEATKEQESILEAARANAAKQIQSAREKIGGERKNARQALDKDVASLSATIATKLSGKEISL